MTATPDNPAAPAIQADAVCFAYPGGIAALDGVSLSVGPGEFLAVVGANGSGKTTLMKVLLRLLRPQGGCVRLFGRDIAALPADELYRRVGMVFQNPTDQLFAPTVEQDVAFGPRNLGLPEGEVRHRVEHALANVGAADLAGRPIHRLSFGEQKRACLAGVLAMQPDVLLLDEPTAGLDPAGEAHMIELLGRLNREQRITMILCTHAVDLLAGLADRVCVLHRGRVERVGGVADCLADPAAAARVGLRLPLIGQLFDRLARCDGLDPPPDAGPLPMTVDEARKRVLGWLNGRADR